MRYNIFTREIYKDRKTNWEDTEKVIEADNGKKAIYKWLEKYSPAVICPEGYAAGSTYFGSRAYAWQELRDFNASSRYPEEEYFSLELKARRVK